MASRSATSNALLALQNVRMDDFLSRVMLSRLVVKEGALARCGGDSDSANPYPAHSDWASLWLAGFLRVPFSSAVGTGTLNDSQHP
jgi:hypothetical protein